MKFPNLPAMGALTGTEIIPGTQAAVDGRTTAQDIANLANPDADNVAYDNAVSGLTATDVQAAIDELADEFMTNPMTTAGDIVVGGVSGAPARLAKGLDGQVLKMVGGVQVYAYPIQSIIVACSDETTNLTTGTAKVTFRMPYAFTLTGVRASLTTAQAAGSIFTVDINEAGATILSTKITIDNSEKTSTTAATPPVISDASLADDAEITIDIDQVGTALAKGLKVALIGYPTP